MENIKLFLETSTIHGLSYIAGSRPWVRLFWIITVIAGFTLAGTLMEVELHTNYGLSLNLFNLLKIRAKKKGRSQLNPCKII